MLNPGKAKHSSSTHRSETDLWVLFSEGNEFAFSQLYTQCFPKLFSYSLNLGMSDSQAKDAIQDLFLKLYDRPLLIKDPDTIRAFMFRSVKNHYLNILKKGERSISLDTTETAFHFNYIIDDTALAKEEQEEVKQRVDKLLSTLTPRQREIIYFRFLHEMEYEEISKIMNISEQSARNLLHKAFDKVRNTDPKLFLLLSLIRII